jgi:dihydrodipicolinate synthase/N-acetylneuraminate lyase
VALRQAAARGDWQEAERLRVIFEPLEDLRNAISPICVLHEAVAAAGITDTGPLLPLLDRVPEASRPAIAVAARQLVMNSVV